VAYDRDLTANPLRRLRGSILDDTNLKPTTRKHLIQAVDDLIAQAHGFHAQQAAEKGLVAHMEALRCRDAMRTSAPGNRVYREAMLAFTKLTILSNACFKIAAVTPRLTKQRVKPPTRSTEQAAITD
jgi:hypothetical protein